MFSNFFKNKEEKEVARFVNFATSLASCCGDLRGELVRMSRQIDEINEFTHMERSKKTDEGTREIAEKLSDVVCTIVRLRSSSWLINELERMDDALQDQLATILTWQEKEGFINEPEENEFFAQIKSFNLIERKKMKEAVHKYKEIIEGFSKKA